MITLPHELTLSNAPSLKGQHEFNPFTDLLVSQETKPLSLRPADWRTITPFQRALLVIDGTVTKFIEAYALEPVESVRLQQQTQLLASAHAWLKTPANTEVIGRQVLLRGRYSATVYAYAVSLLVPTRLPVELLHALETEPAGIGRVLLNSHIENRREILWYGYEQLTDLPDEIRQLTGVEFLSRTYRIINGGQPVMLINEKFPMHQGNL